MKTLFHVIRHSFSKPHLIFSLTGHPWKYFRRLSRLVIFWMTLTLMVSIFPSLNTITSDISASSQAVPEFTTENGQLQLGQDQKPSYYQSTAFQLVVDDTVTLGGSPQSPTIPSDIAQRLSATTPSSLFLFRDRAFVLVNGRLIQIVDLYTADFSASQLRGYLTDFNNYQWVLYLSLFLVSWIASWLLYWGLILIASYIAHFTTLRSKGFKLFSQTMRLVMLVTYVPLMLYSLVRLLLPLRMAFYIGLLFYVVGFIFYAQQRFMIQMIQAYSNEELKRSLAQLEAQSDQLSSEELNQRILELMTQAQAHVTPEVLEALRQQLAQQEQVEAQATQTADPSVSPADQTEEERQGQDASQAREVASSPVQDIEQAPSRDSQSASDQDASSDDPNE